MNIVLYGLSVKNKIKEWSGSITHDSDNSATLIISYGELNGKKVVSTKNIKYGKNIGKNNETTPFQQGEKELKSKANKKIDAGYVDSLDKLDKNTDITLKPMLAVNYRDRSHDIRFPCFIQPKLDGVRCLIVPNKKLFISRGGKHFFFLESLLDTFLTKTVPETYVYDCELYGHDMNFEDIVSTVRQKNQEPDATFLKNLRLCCFDMFDTSNFQLPFYERLGIIYNTVNTDNIVTTLTSINNDNIMAEYKEFTNKGYEGVMIRNRDGLYKCNYRSADLQKYKEFIDSEYPIINFKESTGKARGQIILICETPSGKTFSVRPKGTDAYRKQLFQNANELIGKMLTVQYQEFTSSSSDIPRFPVGISIRDYE